MASASVCIFLWYSRENNAVSANITTSASTHSISTNSRERPRGDSSFTMLGLVAFIFDYSINEYSRRFLCRTGCEVKKTGNARRRRREKHAKNYVCRFSVLAKSGQSTGDGWRTTQVPGGRKLPAYRKY